MARSKQQCIADAITRRVMDNNRKRARYHIADVYEEFAIMANRQGSCVTSGMNTSKGGLRIQLRPQPLIDPAQQQRMAEEPVSRVGTSTDPRPVSPNEKAVDTGTMQGVGTNASDGGNVGAMSVDAKDVSADFGWKPGSHPGDTRSQAQGSTTEVLDKLANGPSPRRQMQGQKNTRDYLEDGKGFKSTPTGLDSDAGV
jgi:hypothetical protein